MIVLELDNQHIMFDSHPYSSGYWLRDEVFKWLVNNVGPGSQCGGAKTGDTWFWAFQWDDRGPKDNRLVFANLNHCLMFKLAWGGV